MKAKIVAPEGASLGGGDFESQVPKPVGMPLHNRCIPVLPQILRHTTYRRDKKTSPPITGFGAVAGVVAG